ncbi:MAG: hypothetical protein M4579_001598 [Chaenotheca gracillima]|nr:MAG: hypothetical protein M4579_001598 [Chaenotheca gracillima]
MVDQEAQTTVPHPPAEADGTYISSLRPIDGQRQRRSSSLNNLLPKALNGSTSVTSTAEADSTARGETSQSNVSDDEARTANRTAALRQLNGSSKSKSRSYKAAGAGSSSSSQPVIVRTYPRSMRTPETLSEAAIPEDGEVNEANLPSVEAFSFEGILRAIEPEISGTLDAIAAICARSRYSLSNQYEVHMPSHDLSEQKSSSRGNTELRTGEEVSGTQTQTADQLLGDVIKSSSVQSLTGRDVAVVHCGNDVATPTNRDGKVQSELGGASKGEGGPSRGVIPAVSSKLPPVSDLEIVDEDPTEHRLLPGMLFSGFTSLGKSKTTTSTRAQMTELTSLLVASPAPHVLTGTQLAVSSVRDAGNVPKRIVVEKIDAGMPKHSPEAWSSQNRPPSTSRLGTISSWLPWFGQSQDVDSIRQTKRSSAPMAFTNAENRLRVLLGVVDDKRTPKGKQPAR